MFSYVLDGCAEMQIEGTLPDIQKTPYQLMVVIDELAKEYQFRIEHGC